MHMEFTNLVAMQMACCERYANNPLFGTKIDQDFQWVTYAEFAKQVDQCRAALKQLGIQPGDVIGIISNNRVEWAAITYAAMGLGALFAPMYLDQHQKDWLYMLNDCQAKLVFVSNQSAYEKLDLVRSQLNHTQTIITLDAFMQSPMTWQQFLHHEQASPPPALTTRSKESCCIVYTSGTTGNPKGVLLSHHNLLFEVQSGLSEFKLQPHDRSLSFLPWAHIFGHVTEVHAILYSGMSTALVRDISEFNDDIKCIRPSVLYAVPRVYSRMYAAIIEKIDAKPLLIKQLFYKGTKLTQQLQTTGTLPLTSRLTLALAKGLIFKRILKQFGGRLRVAVSGASKLEKTITQLLVDIGIPVYQGYGLTETTAAFTVNTPGHNCIGSVGRPLPDCRVTIDNKPGESEGEVICYGNNIMQGYYELPDKTNDVMTADGGFKTGDVGRLDDQGYLHITGRIKDQFKLENGKYVTPAPIEEKIELHALFEHALVFGSGKPYVVVLLVITPNKLKAMAKRRRIRGDLETICHHAKTTVVINRILEQQLKDEKNYTKPKKFLIYTDDWTINNNLLTPTLKLRRKNIEAKFASDLEQMYQVS